MDSKCPICQEGALLPHGLVDGLGHVFVCSDDDCDSFSKPCPACDNTRVFAENESGKWQLSCFNPLCDMDKKKA